MKRPSLSQNSHPQGQNQNSWNMISTLAYFKCKNFIRWPQQMASKAEQKIYVIVIEQTLPYVEPDVICRKSVTAALEQVNLTASPDPIPSLSPHYYFAIFKIINSQQPLQNLQCWTFTRKHKKMLMVLLKERIQPEESQTPLDTQKCYWHPKWQLPTQTRKRQTWSWIAVYQEKCFLAFHA